MQSTRARPSAASFLDPETAAISARSTDGELRLPEAARPRTTAPYLSLDTPQRERQQIELAHRLDAHLAQGRAQVILTDNVHTMLSIKRRGDTITFRAHHLFADAPPKIVRAIVAYAEQHDAHASELLRDYVDRHERKIRTSRPRERATQGQCYDLTDIFQALNTKYFDDQIDASVTWGPRARRQRARSSIKLGSYTVEDRLIRIHPVLDQPSVPRYFVEWIVYHEMLHQRHEMPVIDGRRVHHTRAFRRDEAKFEQYTAAVLWERVHLHRLL